MERQKIEYIDFLNHLNTFMTSENVKSRYFVYPVWMDIQTAIFAEIRRLEFEEYCKDPKNHQLRLF